MTAQDVLNRQLMSAIEQPQEASPDKHLLASFEAMNSSASPRGLDRQDRKKVACYLQMPQGRSDRVLDHGSASPKVSSSREVSTQEREANSILPAGQSPPQHAQASQAFSTPTLTENMRQFSQQFRRKSTVTARQS